MFGYTEQDTQFQKELLQKELAYAQAVLNTPDLTDVDREALEAHISQLSDQLAEWGISEIDTSLYGEVEPLLAGFDFSKNWPMLAIIGVGILTAIRGRKKRPSRRRKRRQ